MNTLKIVVPTPFEIGPVNVYVIGDDQLALIDTGPKTEEAIDALHSGLASVGLSLRDIDYVIVTHAHEDHYGLARFVANVGAKVYTHMANVPLMAKREQEWHRVYNVVQRRLLFSAGVPEEIIDAVQPAIDFIETCGEQVNVDKALDDGDVIHVGRKKLIVVHTPGHARGAICLYSPEERALFGGDHLLAHVSSNAVIDAPLDCGDCRSRSLVDYLASLRRVYDMDISVVYPAHGEEIRDHRSLIDERLAFYERRKHDVLEILGKTEKTPYQVAIELFPKVGPLEVFLAVSEVIGHLDLLEDEGKVSWENVDGVIRYFRTSYSEL